MCSARATRIPAGRPKPPERRAQLLRLGLELFGSRSYDDVSIDDIAARAGISRGLLYHYFPTKRAFYVAALGAAAAELERRTRPEDGLRPEQRLAAGLEAYLHYVEEYEAAYRSLFRGGLGVDSAVCEIVERTRRVMTDRFLDALGVRRPRATLRIALRGWLGYVEAASLEWLAHRNIRRRQLVRLLVLAAGATLLTACEVDPGIRLPAEILVGKAQLKK